MKLSIIIPVFNEVRTIEEVVRRASSSPVEMDREIIVVDDGSTDGTAELLHGLEPTLPNGNGTRVLVRYATANAGKGSAIRMGLQAATGDIILFQDADLELDPAEYPKLLEPILAGKSRVVYGRRNYWSVPGSHWTSRVANGVLALLTSVLYGQVVVDMETAYKVMRRDAIAPLKLAARGFEIEPELTAKLRRAGEHILEVPIDYRPRTVAEGKKMRWKDGFIAVKTLLACRVAPLSDCVERSTPTAPRGLLTWGRLAAGGLVLALVLLGLFLGISHAFQGSRRLGEPTFSRGSGSRQADVQMDVLTLARDGSCRWQRRLTIDNTSTSTVVEVLSNFPVLACSPFVVTDEADRLLRSSARLESRGLRLFVNPTPPIAPGQTRRLTIETLVRGLLRTPYDGSGRPRLELRVRQFVSHGAKSSLLLRLPEGVEPAHVTPAGLPWDLLARTPGGLTVCWNDLSSHVADELVGVSLDLGNTGMALPANIPAVPSTLLAAATLVFLAALSVLWVAWRGPPRLHEPALLLAMAIQFFLFFQPMLLEDNMSYLAYVRSWWFDGDLDMLNDYKLHNSYGIYSPNPLEPVGPTGASVMLAPFFLLGVALRNALAAAGWSYPANGFSWPYVAAVGAGSFLYVTWGLLLTYRMVRETVGPRLALASTLAVGFGTNLMLVTSFWDASTHAPSFFLVTAFLRLWWTTRLDRSASGWTLLGLLGGLAVQTRYQNFPFLALPLMDSAWLVWSERGAQARHRLGIAALYGYAGGALLGLSAQLLLWTLLEGRPFVDNYGGDEGPLREDAVAIRGTAFRPQVFRRHRRDLRDDAAARAGLARVAPGLDSTGGPGALAGADARRTARHRLLLRSLLGQAALWLRLPGQLRGDHGSRACTSPAVGGSGPGIPEACSRGARPRLPGEHAFHDQAAGLRADAQAGEHFDGREAAPSLVPVPGYRTGPPAAQFRRVRRTRAGVALPGRRRRADGGGLGSCRTRSGGPAAIARRPAHAGDRLAAGGLP
ncbi:MAG: glycosyltransferase family 2 protein, partial [Candidatus Wallbacteria bacterium]|nr:glycosyltransferase family 2 protein [Candidatus Wallbacteria bacterium]